MDETEQMNELILEMLDLFKLESKAYVLKQECFHFNGLVHHVLNNKEKLFENQRIQLMIDLEEQNQITADYKRMEDVLNNLIVNAVYHTPQGGKIFVTRREGIFSIENEGKPINKIHLPYIWDAFYKGQVSQGVIRRGTGLGLSIVKNILELHQIRYGVENTAKGVRFWFEIK